MTTALATVDRNTQAALEKYSSDKFNVLLPTPHLGEIAQMHTIRLEVVQLNPDPDAGDFYPDDKGGGLRPTKQGLEKISSVGGIQWNYRDSGTMTPTACEKCLEMARATKASAQCATCAHRDDVKFKAIGAVRKPSGEWIVLDATYELDFTTLEKEKTPGDVASIRRHRVARSETGAQNRVIRNLMLVKNKYTKTEAAKPFVVPRIDLALDYSDPLVRQAVLSRALTAGAALFGGPSGRAEVVDISPVEPQGQRPALGTGEEASEPAAEDVHETGKVDQAQPIRGEPFEPDPEPTPMPRQKGVDYLECKCGGIVEAAPDWPIPKIQQYLMERYGEILCPACRRKVKR